MAKKIKKSAGKAKKINKAIEEDAKLIVERGNVFGDSIIAQMSLTATDILGIAAATVGLAKAVAALKDVARRVNMSVDSLFEQEVKHYEGEFAEFPDLSEM